LTPPAPGRPAGLFRFAIEGRHAPGLFVLGWLATILGVGIAAIGFLAGFGSISVVLIILGLALLSIGLALLAGSQTVERSAAGLAYGGPSPLIVFATAVAVTPLALVVVGLPFGLLGIHLDAVARDVTGAALQAAVFMGVVQLLVVGPGAMHWPEMGFGIGARRALDALVMGAALAVPVLLVTSIVAAALVRVVGVLPESPLPPTGTLPGLVVHLLAGAILAPVGEEILFRGVAVTAWARSAGARTAIVRSALLFATAHVLGLSADSFQQGASLALVAAAARLPVALALGWIYLRSGTIWAPIGLHAAFNAILIVLGEVSTGSLS
jgi:membrane protease YdiL (CAAX protease family)